MPDKLSQLPPDCSLHQQAALINKAAFAGCLHRASSPCFPRARPGSTRGGICRARVDSPSTKPGWKPSKVQDRQKENSKRKNKPVRGKRDEHARIKRDKKPPKMIGMPGLIDAGSTNLCKNRAENGAVPQITTNKQRFRICCLYTDPLQSTF